MGEPPVVNLMKAQVWIRLQTLNVYQISLLFYVYAHTVEWLIVLSNLIST